MAKVELRTFGEGEFQWHAVVVTRKGNKVDACLKSDFERVEKFGNPCPEADPVAAARDDLSISIPVSNTADSFAFTRDGRFAVVVGRGPAPTFAAPVSLVDFEAGSEVDTLPFDGIGTFVAACDDGELTCVWLQIRSSRALRSPPQVHADEVAFPIAGVEQAVGEGGDGPAFASEDLGA